MKQSCEWLNEVQIKCGVSISHLQKSSED